MNAHIRLVDLLDHAAARWPERLAFADAQHRVTYTELQRHVQATAGAIQAKGIAPGDRIATYAPKQYENVVFLLAANRAGAVFVPINPQLKEHQVVHIVKDSGTRLLATNAHRLRRLPALQDVAGLGIWLLEEPPPGAAVRDVPAVDSDPAAILYTSGSTGKPKGVVLSQRNLVSGAQSVAAYQGLREDDVILGVLPLSFDAGLSQLTTALASGACYAPLDFLQPAEVPAHCEAHGVTSITGVPPLWTQLMSATWPEKTAARIRRFANTGGHMPTPLLRRLQRTYPNAKPYLMYGLTEAFRSTYLPPEDAVQRPSSIGKAVPNAEILVLRPDGTPCDVDEPGELVHRGAFVTLGYWNDPELTRERFRSLPSVHAQIPHADRAVWSGDIVRRDAEGYLYFVARGDDMIKASGYRVSPTEVEEILLACPHVVEAAALGAPHPTLGQAIVACVQSTLEVDACRAALLGACRERLPSYMVPSFIEVVHSPLPRNPNGKIDRTLLKQRHANVFVTE
ncbi:acyl-CoA ligase (AMP-forming), exosortase A system-associated [Pendulispora brunnea]|uniref:Acyl-CoA ligase (AMP-forming), exosortase A system-associated n=1 Tax=Pendulispora brunnea TaxID=2905690 RepID=A0ABZ2K2H2_9BACT